MLIGRQIRHMNRYREIAAALIRHGFGFIVEGTELFHALSLPARLFRGVREVERKSVGERLRYVIQELGPTFVKLGQIASTRSDMLPGDIVAELSKLQDQVEPFPYAVVEEIVASELGGRIADLFASFDPHPIAAASIGQVHIGTLRTGERVAVKIQRPGIAPAIRTDLEILRNLAAIAEARFEWARRYQLQGMIAELSRALLQELDYQIEGRNTDQIARQFKGDPKVRVPVIHWKQTSKRVLVMEYLEGVKVSERDRLVREGVNRKGTAERILNALFRQMFVEGFFHADPHPGNLLAMPDGSIAFIDFGMVGRMTESMKESFSDLIIALMRQSTEGILKAVLRMGLVSDDVPMDELRRDVEDLRTKYYGVPFSEMSLGEAVNDLLDTARRHNIRIPTDFLLLGKALLTVEGVVVALDPDISIVSLAEPFGLRLLRERLRPKRLAAAAWRDASEYGDLLAKLPKQANELMNVVKNGQARLEISVPELDVFLRKLDRISNRLSFSVVMLAISIVMAGLIVGSSLSRQPGLLLNVPAIIIGFGIAMAMLAWLLFAIFKSGRF
ncbi:ABC1 kinase family protein [Paenibacillus antri]|nr:AarF/ABC1/UbiB kinase family protein [Paenibacillus antri]